RGRLTDELGEAGGERPEARTADGEADVGHAHVAVSQQGLGPLDPARHEVRVGRLGIRLAEPAAEVPLRHQRRARERGDVEGSRVLAIHAVTGPAQPAQLVEVDAHACILHRPGDGGRLTMLAAVRPLAEQTILVTGATDGLGRALVAELAASGADVLVHGRDEGRGRDTLADIRDRTPDARVRFVCADLASLAEVRDLADQVKRETGRLDVLVNNAGIGFTTGGEERREESLDGYELRFAVNYLAGYLLTRLLLPLLERSAPARIVNVSSAGQAAIDF